MGYLDVIRRLIPGGYFVEHGSDKEQKYSRYFYRLVSEHIPEVSEDEAEGLVRAAVEWATENICRPIGFFNRIMQMSEDKETKRRDRYTSLYECEHPETGRFYMLVVEDYDKEHTEKPINRFSLILSRDEQAVDEFRDVIVEEGWSIPDFFGIDICEEAC